MSIVYTISMKKAGGSAVLAGAAAGNAVQLRALEELGNKPVDVCCLDFRDVECATASFLREAVFGTREAVRRNGLGAQIIIANVDKTSMEELLLVSRALGSSVVHVALSEGSKLSRPVILGELDEAQRETLALVLQLGEATATELAAEKPDVKPTAWNNRLTSLVGRGILSEAKRERHKVYRPVVKGLTYGC